MDDWLAELLHSPHLSELGKVVFLLIALLLAPAATWAAVGVGSRWGCRRCSW